MQPLTRRSFKVGNIGEDLPTADYVKSALERGLSEFQPATVFNDGHLIIVGSGPSVTSFLDGIKEERRNGRPICAVKGTHDWLIENGIEPDLFVSLEPRQRPFKQTSERTTYLVASRCPPELFDQLKDRNVIVWHAAASKPSDALIPDNKQVEWDELNLTDECLPWKGRFGVGGGTTSGLRAITLGFLLGFRKFILYGFDSCLAPDKHTKRFTGENTGTAKIVDVIVGGKRFWCNGSLAQQALEFQEMYKMPNISIEAKGNGLIAAIIAERKKRGYHS